MFPALISAMCAVTWHFFENADALSWLVTVQAGLTLIGNITLAIAAYFIWCAPHQAQNGAESR
jgi:hypothetical protein